MKRRSRSHVFFAAIAAGFATAIPAANAIEMTLNYNTAASNEPAGDPDDALLAGIMQHIRTTYQNAFADTHAITINFWYEDLGTNTAGLHTIQGQSGTPNRETLADIRINPNGALGFGLYFDATPADNSEYNVGQTLYRSLSPAQRTSFYNAGANIPATFEASFSGPRNSSNPATLDKYDLLSVAFHEVGHALGMSGGNNATIAETNDGDYDYQPANVFGRTLAAKIAGGTNRAHLENSLALMFPSATVGGRVLPSQTDFLSMVAGHAYTQLNLPRREFYGGANWNLAANWSGNAAPTLSNEAFVRASGPAGETRTVGLTANAAAGTLTVSEGSSVDLNSFRLDTLSTRVGAASTITVDAGGLFATNSLHVDVGGQLMLNGGRADVDVINPESFVAGNGTLSVGVGNSTNSIGATGASGGNLVIRKAGNGELNFFGGITNNGVILQADGGLTTLGKTAGFSGFAVAGIVDIAPGALVRVAGSLFDNQIADTAAVRMSGGVLDLNNRPEAFDTLDGTGTVGNGGAFPGTFRLGGAGGSGTFSGTLGSGNQITLIKQGNGTATFRGPIGNIVFMVEGGAMQLFDQSVGSITIGPASLLRVLPTSAGGGRRAVGFTSGVTFNGGAMLDVTDNAIIVSGTSESTIRAQIIAGRAGGAWNGPGINSSIAAGAATDDAVGYALAGSLFNLTGGQTAMFLGKTVQAGDLLARYTILGDANIDGSVNIGDFSFLATNFNVATASWRLGDFNYDGTTNISDFSLLASNFNQSLPAGLPRGSTALAAGSAVPEPAAISLFAFTVIALRRRI